MILKKRKIFYDFAASKGLRAIRQRNVILDVLLSTHQYMNLEEFYLKIKSCNPGIAHATVYRTLKLREEITVRHGFQNNNSHKMEMYGFSCL